ncbi:hypothetical protein BC355_12145 [Vibrio cholerae]|uniref:Integrase n=1 Tax=Vibrio cholerae TaxID=666 RepID=A0A395TQX6_VIBCL|nr:hypothetical protein [Vibrio cholerae]RGP87154.1 hypothetical protein BC353_03125 [Vibrio cholerae]RGP87662.1 hypothetical protein BC355_12145 [Vibrio cholerae]RGP88595.1 hypothetical protein BC354_10730 [Vibrio cholerae]RGP94985.1 hypothetical protein BC352_10625 [Vibrio cholerae]TLE14586.1 hypothetical protein D2B32_02325 [Vibrio cholerae]
MEASNTLNEQGFDRDLVEAALAHVDDNQVRSAYNRTDYLEHRRPSYDELVERAYRRGRQRQPLRYLD